MESKESRVKILNDHGEVVGGKPRSDVDKVRDIVHCADVLLFQDGQIVLSRIPDGGLYAGTLSSSCATMVREGEETEKAAHRALQKELGMETAALTLLGEHFFTYSDGVKRLKTSYAADFEGALSPNPKDVAELVYMKRSEIEAALGQSAQQFAPTFQELWKMYTAKLPF